MLHEYFVPLVGFYLKEFELSMSCIHLLDLLETWSPKYLYYFH